jgi:hypothetical protein
MADHAKPPQPRHCPICGVAMNGEKSRPERELFDIFHCLNCETIIDLSDTKPNNP